MSIHQFEIGTGGSLNTVLSVDAFTNEAIVDISNNLGRGADATFAADQLRRLRRFLEYAYPASEDPPHEPDPWESAGSGWSSVQVENVRYWVKTEASGGER